MRNGEVKRFKFINGVGNWSHEEAVLASDHDRIVAELKAYVEETNRILRDVDKQCYQDERTIDKQAKVIEVLKACILKEDHRCGIWHDGRKAIEQAESIERGEA